MPTVDKQGSLKRSSRAFSGSVMIARRLARKTISILDRVTRVYPLPPNMPLGPSNFAAFMFALFVVFLLSFFNSLLDQSRTTAIKSFGGKGVFGRDNRRETPGKYNDLTKSIGRLDARVSQKWNTCTAFCVADSVVAIAAHCLFTADFGARFPSVSVTIGEGRDRRTSEIHGRTADEKQWSVIAGSTFQKKREAIQHSA